MKQLFLANLSGREKILLYLTLAVIVLSLGYNYLLKGIGARWGELNAQILSKEIALKKNVAALRQRDKVQRLYYGYEQYAVKGVSDEEDMAFFLNEVETQARRSGMRIANIKPGPVKEFSNYKRFGVEMTCEMPLERFVEFVYNLQTSAHLIRIERLKLMSQGKGNPLLKAEMFATKVQAFE